MQTEQPCVFVPVEPTEAMIEAIWLVISRNHPDQCDMGREVAIDAYRAMIAARPADSDMVERVAKALCFSSGDDPEREGPWKDWWEESPYAAQARAVIAARPAMGEDVVEKVARALYEEDDPWCKAWLWPNLHPHQGDPEAYRRLARAAIAAMGSADMGKGGEG